MTDDRHRLRGRLGAGEADPPRADSPAVYRWFIEAPRVVTSRIGIIESLRASSRRVHDPTHRDRVIASVGVFELDADIAAVAATVGAPTLRTLDAIHIATAMSLAPELDAFVTYDDRMAEAARSLGMPVVRPG
jgi:predicted nucleic acid-binding protein